MLGVTERAIQMLESYLEQKNAPVEGCVRLLLTDEGGGEFELDEQKPADRRYRHGDKTVLVLDKSLARAFADLTLDYEDGHYCWHDYGAEYSAVC